MLSVWHPHSVKSTKTDSIEHNFFIGNQRLDAELALHGVGGIVDGLACFLLATLDSAVGGIRSSIGGIVGCINYSILGIFSSVGHVNRNSIDS